MITLRIFVMGLVALVPSEDPLSLTMVVRTTSDEAHHEHVPFLAWDEINNPEEGDGARLKELLEVDGTPHGYLLDGQEISIEPVSQNKLEFEGGLTSGPSNRRLVAAMPTGGTKRDFSWVPSMATLTGQMGFLDPSYYRGTDPKLVAGRLTLEVLGGRVSTFSFADILGTVKSVRFVGVARAPLLAARQAVADVLVIEATYEDEELEPDGVITIRGNSLDGRGRSWSVDLRPDGDPKQVDVLIGNLTPMRDLSALVSPEATLHFDLYNSMLALRSSYGDRLFPRLGEAAMVGDGVDPNYCALPAVLKVVAKGECREGTPRGGIARPICMLASFQPPQ